MSYIFDINYINYIFESQDLGILADKVCDEKNVGHILKDVENYYNNILDMEKKSGDKITVEELEISNKFIGQIVRNLVYNGKAKIKSDLIASYSIFAARCIPRLNNANNKEFNPIAFNMIETLEQDNIMMKNMLDSPAKYIIDWNSDLNQTLTTLLTIVCRLSDLKKRLITKYKL
jgi:hypothetical protein